MEMAGVLISVRWRILQILRTVQLVRCWRWAPAAGKAGRDAVQELEGRR